ncbi:MAG: radical SAM protein [Candidatus Aenigmatarchaeota archaeon]
MELLTELTVFKHKLWAFEYADRMEKWFRGFSQAPIRIDAEPHTRCNLNCRMCARRGSTYEKLTEEERRVIELTPKKWVNIAEEAGKMGVKAWNISGLCEPLSRPDILFPLMKMIKAYDMFGELTTNGTLWNEKYVRETIEMGWDSICISIDAHDAKIHDFLRGVKGTFKRAIQTLKKFYQMKKKYKTSLPVLTVNVVLNKLNYMCLSDIVKMVNQFGGDAIFVEPMIVFGQFCEKLKMDKKEIDEFVEVAKVAKELANQLGILLDITTIAPGEAFSDEKKFDKNLIKNAGEIKNLLIDEAKTFEDKILSIPCYYPWFNLMIRADGSTVHCGEWKGESENIKTTSLSDIWFGKILSRIRDQFSKGELPSSCEKCRPNVIEDTRIVRKSIKEFNNLDFLKGKYIEFLEENKRLKQEIFSLRRKGFADDIKCVNCKYKKEIEKFKNSLIYKIFRLLRT